MPQLVERLAEARLQGAWESVVGREVALRSRPGVLAEGCLTVTVDNSPWLHELSLRRPELLAAIQRRHPSVRALRFTVGPLPPAAKDERGASARRVALSEQDRREIEEATAVISDTALAGAARRVMARARGAVPEVTW